jgi:ElaB/YqjD/DUF883 family membrane-anchored ribosome-binding protein
MADHATSGIAALQTEIKQLRADFARMELQAEPSIDKVWTEVKRHADSVSREIEQRPVAAAPTAFGAGALLGLLLTRHRS